jgi:UDP-glucuronate 4-epimerase
MAAMSFSKAQWAENELAMEPSHLIVNHPILVTGAYGLIGHAVVERLRASEQIVIASDQLETAPDDASFHAVPLKVAGVDIISDFLQAHRIGTIVHAAGISGPMLARSDPHRILRVNAGGTLDLFEAARHVGIKRVVLLSSASVYGRTADIAVDEAMPLDSRGAYGVSKICAESVARAYAAEHDVAAVILRPSWVYGPRRRTDCVIRTMISDALKGRPTHLAYGRGFPRQFVHVDDVASAVMAAVSRPAALGRIFNISDGVRRTLEDVARLVDSLLPDARIKVAEGDAPDDEPLGQLKLNNAALHLGWHPRISLDAGIRSYAAYLGALNKTPG